MKLMKKVLTGSGPEAISATSLKVSQAIIQPKRSNANAIEVGPSSTFAAGEGFEFPKPTADAFMEPLVVEPPQGANGIDLSGWYVVGTAGQGINIIYEEY